MKFFVGKNCDFILCILISTDRLEEEAQTLHCGG